ncbi:MAG TPA: hypothetical protein PKG63_04520 [Bacteroidales bacterium]|jgi:hypothetical protein|nr:hypothetical protein [Bacteroidales bacterium]HNV95716.1 hypothetical protein [Bacteroidales bacterium]HOU98158.1 hypothetical protein [Bacteroidales bacterium]
MKTLLLSFAMLFLFFNSWSLPTIPIDSLEKRLNVVEMELKVLKTVPNFSDEDVLIQNLQGKATKQIKIIKNKEIRNNVIKQLPLSHKILVLSPLFTVFLMMLLLCIFLKRAGFSLREALSSKKTTPDGQISFYPSSSKLFALLTIVMGIIFSTFIFTFYLYFAFKQQHIPNFFGLWPIAIILFIGILPYIFQSMFKK